MMEETTLKKIAEFIRTGKTPPTKETKYFNGDVQWFTPGDLDKSKFLSNSVRTLTQDSFTDKKAVRFPVGTLLVACIGDIGKLGITTQECSSNQQLTGVKPNSGVDVNYLYYWFRKNRKAIQHHANNAVVPILNNRSLEQIKIPLPPLAEQQKIAAILDAADTLRQKDQQLIDHYTTLSQSLFLEMFGDPVTNPMGWEKKGLSDFIKSLNTGVSVNSTDEKYSSGQYGILKTSCVYSGEFNADEAKVIRDDEFERMKLNPTADSIIVSRMNTTELVGKSAYIKHDHPLLFLPDRLWQSEKSDLQHNVRWLGFALSLGSFRHEIGKISSGTSGSMKNISKKNFLCLPMIYPPIKLQTQFAERIQQIEAQKQQAQASLEHSDALFNSLLQRAFSGELTNG